MTKNQILSYVRAKLLAKYPKLYITSQRTYAPEQFPCLELKEVYVSPVRENINLADNSYRITMEAQAFSNKQSGAAEEVYKIIRDVELAFNEIGFRMQMCEPTENTKEITVKRHLARFTRIVCSSDTIPSPEGD